MGGPSEPLPPTVSQLLTNPQKTSTRYQTDDPSKWRRPRAQSISSRLFPKRRADTPSASFYRLYEFFVLGWTTEFRDELDYFCCTHPEWPVSSLPDPADPDPLRYAVLAVLSKLMCISFNQRIKLGIPRSPPIITPDNQVLQLRTQPFEKPPEWVERVDPVKERVFIPDSAGHMLGVDDPQVSEEFKSMNIIVKQPRLHFI